MEILNSGSFVPLENREKIEQLKFTAKELAGEAARSVGFQNNGPTNQQLALEMWKGAEYVCRAHEEATVRNIFLSSFLEKLRDLARVTGLQPPSRSVQDPQVAVPLIGSSSLAASPQAPVATAAPATSTDEYLGVVPTIEELDRELRPSYADECVPEYDAGLEALVDRLDEQSNSEAAPSVTPVETAPEQTSTVNSADVSPSEGDSKTIEKNTPCEKVGDENHTDDGEPTEPGLVESIVLEEKEPYNFDSCTVTAVVQLLPEAGGIRKCVVSVRTHSFSPRVVIAEFSAADFATHIPEVLGPVFEQYRNELPAMGAEKLRKEKPATKKASKPVAKASKAGAAVTKSDPTAPPSTESPAADQNQQGLFAA